MPDINVEVVYALPERQYLRRIKLSEGANVEQAIQKSGLLALRTEIDLTKTRLGFTAARSNYQIRCMKVIG